MVRPPAFVVFSRAVDGQTFRPGEKLPEWVTTLQIDQEDTRAMNCFRVAGPGGIVNANVYCEKRGQNDDDWTAASALKGPVSYQLPGIYEDPNVPGEPYRMMWIKFKKLKFKPNTAAGIYRLTLKIEGLQSDHTSNGRSEFEDKVVLIVTDPLPSQTLPSSASNAASGASTCPVPPLIPPPYDPIAMLTSKFSPYYKPKN